MQENRKHILVICPFVQPNLGGVETHIDKLIIASVKAGYYLTIITYQPLTRKIRGAPYEKGVGYEIYRADWFGLGWFTILEKYFPAVFMYLFPGLFVESLRFYLKNNKKITCIHAHGLVSAVITEILSAIKRKKIILSTHAVYNFGTRSKILSFLVEKIFRGFDVILAVSDVSKRELISLGLDPKKILVHPNWIDTDKFIPIRQVGSKFTADKRLNLLFIGRLIEKKGIRLLLEASVKLPNMEFHIVGDGPLEGTVIEQINRNKNVYYYKALNQSTSKDLEKIVNLYSTCDYTISPYLYDEGFSTVLIESISCGTTVIVPNRGSPPTFLDSSVAIFLSKNPTAAELVSVIDKLPKKTAKAQTTCRKFALKNFSVKNASVITSNYTNI